MRSVAAVDRASQVPLGDVDRKWINVQYEGGPATHCAGNPSIGVDVGDRLVDWARISRSRPSGFERRKGGDGVAYGSEGGGCGQRRP